MNKVACAACHREIDSAAKVCPYCGSDPATGKKVVDTSALHLFDLESGLAIRS